jgi:hypothetical protein
MGVLGNNADWSQIPSDVAQGIINNPIGSGREFTRFLLARAKFHAGSSILEIDRSTPFNPAKFLGEGWSIWRGPADGDGLSGDEEQDQKSLALTDMPPWQGDSHRRRDEDSSPQGVRSYPFGCEGIPDSLGEQGSYPRDLEGEDRW